MASDPYTGDWFEREYGDRDWNFYRPILVDCIQYAPPGPWLDLGAGLGLFTECANRFGIPCVALEQSSDAVNTARQRYPELDIRQHSVEEVLPYPKDSFSAIICNQVIEHVSSQTAAFMLAECLRVLVPSGALFVYSPCWHNKKERRDKTHIHLYTPTKLKHALREAGFERIKDHNYCRPLFGRSTSARRLAQKVMRVLPLDILSDTANCIAFKQP